MSVYTKFRKKAAEKISSFESAETFLWNKWMRPPSNEGKEIRSLDSKLFPTNNIILSLEIPVHSYVDPQIVKVKIRKSSLRTFKIKSKTNPVFFQFGLTHSFNIDISYKQELKQFFSAETIYEKESTFMKLKKLKQKEVSKQLNPPTKNIPFSITQLNKNARDSHTENINFHISTKEPATLETDIFTYKTADFDFEITLPAITDYLAKLIPKVYKVALLNSFEEIITNSQNYQIKIDLLDNFPIVYNKNFNVFATGLISDFTFHEKIKSRMDDRNYFGELTPYNVFKVNTYFPGLYNSKEMSFSMFYKSESAQPNLLEKQIDNETAEHINKILQPEINLSEEEEKRILKDLFNYQIEGSKFLIANHFACLADEIGLGKTMQAIKAIKYLIKKREVKSALIISQNYFTGDRILDDQIGNSSGWDGLIHKYESDIKSIIVHSDLDEIKSAFKQNIQVIIVPYELIFKNLTFNLLVTQTIKKFDCICCDDAEILNEHSNNFEKLLKISNTKFTWLLTNLPKDVFHEKFLRRFINVPTLGRAKNQAASEMPNLTKQDFWLELDKDQNIDYNQAYIDAQSQIRNVLQTGNPYRLQAIVFTLLHKLKQITNFSEIQIENNKTKLLTLQLNSIKAFNHKAIVFSQYDKFGTQKLIELFNKKDFKHVNYISSMPPNELENSIKKFKDDKSITVLLASSKEADKIMQRIQPQYIINFDQWWIPIAQWELEDKIINNGSKVHIYNYFTKDTVEEKLASKLIEKDLLTKDTNKNKGADAFSKLLNEKDWLDVFNVKVEKKEVVKDPSTDDE